MIQKLQFKETGYFKQHTDEQKAILIKEFLKVNQEKIKEKIRGRFVGKIYDKKSLINGLSPEQIIPQGFPEDGQIYLVYVDGKLQILQDYHPGESGNVVMTKNNVMDICNEYIDGRVKKEMMGYIITEIDNNIDF